MPINLNRFLDTITTPISFGKPKPYQLKRYFKLFINVNYIAGFLYAFYFYLTSPRATQMFERRLWALECWVILSLYGIFIYLFYVEKSALESQGLFRFTQIQAKCLINASMERVENWFKQLEKDPKLYRFDTHQGVEVVEGNLSQVGSVFTTKESFLGIMIELKFKVSKVTKNSYEFVVISPGWLKKLEVMGKFALLPVTKNQTILQLLVFNKTNSFFSRIVSMLFLYLSPVRLLIAKQIDKEVRLVKEGVEK